jgi:3-deoxy-manno-octulosonate cytidylyltransferase (CMP-KDO synthetase)
MIRNLIVIPARFKSTRLPGKVIADLCGKPVVQYVYEQCLKSTIADKVIIATDEEVVIDTCLRFTHDVFLTSDAHLSGTDRVAEVIEHFPCVNVVNIQGDEPFISPVLIDRLFVELNDCHQNMVSAYHRITNKTELENPNIVKVVIGSENNAIYFSRSPIPYVRPPLDFEDVTFYRHIGVYGYKSKFLMKYIRLKNSLLESVEQLEQLRVIEAGFSIKLIESEDVSFGIDTPEDLDVARQRLGCN